MTSAGFTTYLVKCMHDFCTDRTLSFHFHFNEKNKTPKMFDLGLLQGCPLSPILFLVYSAPTFQPFPSNLQLDSIYVNDDTLLQGSTHY